MLTRYRDQGTTNGLQDGMTHSGRVFGAGGLPSEKSLEVNLSEILVPQAGGGRVRKPDGHTGQRKWGTTGS